MILSAADMVHIVCALLEKTEKDENPIWNNSFWTAHDSMKRFVNIA